MNYKLIISEKSHLAFIYFGQKIIHMYMEHKTYDINDIYQGKISSILPSLNAAFISLHPIEKNGFLHFGDSKLLGKEKSCQKTSNNRIKESYIKVQITREPSGTKGPSVSLNISLIGKYVTLFPLSKTVHIEKKLLNIPDKEYLRAIGHLSVPIKNLGILIRLNSLKVNANFLIKEIKILKLRWVKITKKATSINKPCLISKRKTLINKIFEKYVYLPFKVIATDSYQGALKIKKIISRIYNIKTTTKITIQYHKNNLMLIKHYLIDLIISEIMKPRINLNNGGYIIIEKTEALTSIDVNSGSFKHVVNLNDTSFWINYLAIYEIIKQIHLRNLGGIIVIDLIDSNNQENQIKILQYMEKLMKKDLVQCSIIQLSELGLVEISRSRQGQSIYDAFTRKCTICNGLGYLSMHLNKNERVTYTLILTLSPSFYTKKLDLSTIRCNY